MDKRAGKRMPQEPPEHPNEPKRMERIAARAHELYETRGRDDGRDLDDWLQAEKEVDQLTKQ